MIELLKSPLGDEFDLLVESASSFLIVSSPYIGMGPCKKIFDINNRYGRTKNLSIFILTDLTRETLLSGATDVSAIFYLTEKFKDIEIKCLPKIHAKIYIADYKLAIITSANMTNGGLLRNFEYGVKIYDKIHIEKIRNDILDYATLGVSIDQTKLKFLSEISSELIKLKIKVDKSANNHLRSEFENRLRQFDNEIVRLRVAGRTPHSVFADAILYFLKRRPMTTTELHPLIQELYPDLCDNTIDRIIDGKHFGKKWKHAVRAAQQHLKKRGHIEIKDGYWRLKTIN